jgi:hypothetical protein
MQAKIMAARSMDSSPNIATTARESPAASKTIAECLSRSGHGEKKKEEESSIAIGPVPTFRSSCSSATPAFHELRKVMGAGKLMILVPLSI